MRPLVLVFVLLFVSCDAQPRGAATTSIDSLGVKVTTTAGSALDRTEYGRVENEPLFAVGGRAGRGEMELLDAVKGAAFIGDSLLAILDGGSGQVRFFDAAGQFRAATPGKGHGPGEVEDASALFADGANVIVWDGARAISTTFNTSGHYVAASSADGSAATRAFPALSEYPPVYRWMQVAPSQLLLFVPDTARISPSQERFRPRTTFVTASFDMASRQPLGVFGGLEQVRIRQPRGTFLLPAINAKETYFTAAGGQHLYIGDSDEFRIDRYTFAGARDLTIRVTGLNGP